MLQVFVSGHSSLKRDLLLRDAYDCGKADVFTRLTFVAWSFEFLSEYDLGVDISYIDRSIGSDIKLCPGSPGTST